MVRRIISISVAIFGLHAACIAEEYVDYVNTLVGTMSRMELSTGNTYPAMGLPWGTHLWTPQTSVMSDNWIYSYTSDKIRGFRQTHQPSPWMGDYGQVSIMPVTVGPVYLEDERASWFSHKAETATPYYYKVYLADHDCTVEMTPTMRAAAFRIVYPEREMSYLVVDAFDGGSSVTVRGNRIVGYSTRNSGGVAPGFKNYFIVECDTPFEYETVVHGDRSYGIVGFRTSKGQIVNLKVSSSFISLEQAEINMRELGDGDFERIMSAARREWNEALERIEVRDGSDENLRTFYSCLYRSLLFPRDLSEIDSSGRRVHYSPHDGKVHEGEMFVDTGFWDTFRSLFSLLTLVYPETAVRIQKGLVNHYKESGFLPEWSSPGHRDCMIGNNSASVVAEAYLKGLRGYDIDILWEALEHDAHSVHKDVPASGRLGWSYYDSLGYVPCDVGIKESAARTLEYAYNDWCIYRLGEALKKETEVIDRYLKSSGNYRNLFRGDCSLMSGRRSDGTFPAEFNPFKWGGDFTEGNSLHYSWSVFHDIDGLKELMGGNERFEAALDNIFETPPIFDESYYGFVIHDIREMQIMGMGNYAHGNQPIQHMLYLYDWCDSPWKGQKRIREVMDKLYSCTPDGYCGDEDNGQTSSWYVFSALGFYPVCPVSCRYEVGSPLFKDVRVHLSDGKALRIYAPDNSPANCYVDRITVSGRKHDSLFLEHDMLKDGAVLKFHMTDNPYPKISCLSRKR